MYNTLNVKVIHFIFYYFSKGFPTYMYTNGACQEDLAISKMDNKILIKSVISL